jgi:hypothetical protein
VDRFTVLKDVPLRITNAEYHQDGSAGADHDEWVVFHYNQDGTLYYIKDGVYKLEEYLHYSRVAHSDLYYHYEDGKIVSLDYGSKHGNRRY